MKLVFTLHSRLAVLAVLPMPMLKSYIDNSDGLHRVSDKSSPPSLGQKRNIIQLFSAIHHGGSRIVGGKWENSGTIAGESREKSRKSGE